MRMNARTGAALLAIVVGLALMVFGALGSKGSLPGTLKPPPPVPVVTGALAPIDPTKGIGKSTGEKTEGEKELENLPAAKDDVFASEYGDRGKHEVTVTISANGRSAYLISWRGGKSEKGITASLSRTRTIVGGSPTVQVLGQAAAPASRITCSITVDGVKKVNQVASGTWSVVSCLG